ncbi:MAG: hypothetical protein LBR53_12870 [Deltaproteobacteria bacterium]|jgi:hypothetical protein|nr:hypothetical protein [Deltaproteobacteria bacterium]
MSTYTYEENNESLKNARFAPAALGSRRSRYESRLLESFMESLGLKAAAEPAASPFGQPFPLFAPPGTTEGGTGEIPSEKGEGPAPELLVSRIFGGTNPLDFPSPRDVGLELAGLAALAAPYLAVLYPRNAPRTLGEILKGLDTGYSIEGFVPHRYPDHPFDHDSTSDADFYFLASPRVGKPLPLPFGVTGGPSRLSPVKAESLAEEDPELIIKTLQSLTSQERLTETLPHIYKLAGLRPSDGRIRINLAVNLAILGEGLEAERVLKGVLAEKPNEHEARITLCRLHLSRSDYGKLRAFLPELLFLRKADPKVEADWEKIREGLLAVEKEDA